MTAKPPTNQEALRQLLDAVDAALPDRLRQIEARPRSGPFFEVLESHGLESVDVALILSTLGARLAGEAASSGKDLALAVGDGSASRLEALARLDATAPLTNHGLLIPEVVPENAAEAHDILYRLSDHLFRLACEIFGQSAPAEQRQPSGAFRSNTEILGELRRLSLHYRRRAARVFHLDPWTGTGIEVRDGTAVLVQRAQLETLRIADRLRATPDSAKLPLLELRRQHSLQDSDLVILATILFQEVLEGVGAVDAVDLVKLVSESEAELLENRSILTPLAEAGLLRLEGAYAGKDLTADASLPPEVIAAMLGETIPIDSDHRLDFHAYLQQLDSSDPFFDDMDGSGFGS